MKNRYCRKTKLTEQQFKWITIQFILGVTATQTAKDLARLGIPTSRQSVEKKYVELGTYLYDRYVRTDYAKFAAKLNAPEKVSLVEKMYLEIYWQALTGTLDYAKLRKQKLRDLVDERIALLLRSRRTAFNGFTRDKLPVHLGFAFFFLHVAHEKVSKRQKVLLEQLEKDPL